MDTPSSAERQQMEIELLQAMYPDQIRYDVRSSELKYTGSDGSSLVLRIPASYPEENLPDIISATDGAKRDMRAKTKIIMDDLTLVTGVEVLDTIIQGFEQTCLGSDGGDDDDDVKAATTETQGGKGSSNNAPKTVVIWLHHLLNTNKRKLALSPTTASDGEGRRVSGVTKPGYPGVLVYSGPEGLVDAHVGELRQQRWQAFQVRYEEGGEWLFHHGRGIREVESMSDVVQGVVAESHREALLKAVGVK